MAPQEFKCWFEGFAEGIGEAPSADQWARIKERVAEISVQAPLQPMIPTPTSVGWIQPHPPMGWWSTPKANNLNVGAFTLVGRTCSGDAN